MKVIPATELHVVWLAPIMRLECMQECLAYSGRTPKEALLNGLRKSDVCKTAFSDDGVPLAMFGIGTTAPGQGSCWMLTSQAVKNYAFEFMRACKRELAEIARPWPMVFNYVDARNVPSLRLCKYLGFEIHDPVLHGVAQIPFHPVVFRSEPHV